MHHSEGHRARDIERYTGQPMRVGVIPGLEPKRRPAKPRFGQGKPGASRHAPRGAGHPGSRNGGAQGYGNGGGYGRPAGKSGWGHGSRNDRG